MVVLSIDDLYLPHELQDALAKSHADNPLVQHRGVPATHDVNAGVELFEALTDRKENIKIPSYDKSQFNGAGDRKPESEWSTVNETGIKPVEVIIFEGWCVGFRALSDEMVGGKWNDAKDEGAKRDGSYKGQLGHLKLDDVLFINDRLRAYDALTDRFGAFVHM